MTSRRNIRGDPPRTPAPCSRSNLVGRCLSLIGPLSMALGATPIRILRVVFFRMCFAVPYIMCAPAPNPHPLQTFGAPAD